ncbi:hypothetical protein OBV_23490 [Oscillibacter valericigenes Sjm18-20]|nr:hypothetical protein OBV_23490 [Oscillibacter valericigenes Sjm18-20]
MQAFFHGALSSRYSIKIRKAALCAASDYRKGRRLFDNPKNAVFPADTSLHIQHLLALQANAEYLISF